MTDKKTNISSDNTRKTLTLKTTPVSPNNKLSSSGRSLSAPKKQIVVENKRRKFKLHDNQANSDNTNNSVTQTFAQPRVANNSRRKTTAINSNLNNNFSQNLSVAEQEARKQALQAAQQRKIILEQEEAQREKERIAAELEAAKLRASEPESVSPTVIPPIESPNKLTKDVTPKKPTDVTNDSKNIKSLPNTIEKKEDKFNVKTTAPKRPETESNTPRRSNVTKADASKAPRTNRTTDTKRRNKITISTVFDDEEQIRGRSIASMRRRQEKIKKSMQVEVKEKISREVIIPETITLQELAQRMAERSVDVIKYLMKQGQMLKPGDVIEADMAQLIAEDFGHIVRRVAESDVEEAFVNVSDNPDNFVSRPPVVTVMGHVDHGKTSLLDAFRKSNTVSSEAGGITQHIGAYQVEHNNKKVTFIDTPGHAAFTAMRARGAQITDIAILVVAADDGVMPQTIESIKHAKAANVPIIVAINKIDKPDADPQRVKSELLQHEVFVETMGGDVLEVEVSAKEGTNLNKLLDTILLQAEMLDLKADPKRNAEGTVIEAKLDKGRGTVTTVLIQKGTLSLGDIVIAGSKWGRVRALINDHGKHIPNASLSMPVEILGLQGAPQAGDRLAVVKHESQAREIAEYRARQQREKAIAKQTSARGSLEQMMNQLQTSDLKEFPLVIKADVQGSVEAIVNSLEKLNTNEVRAHIIYAGVGGITETDISLAEASNAMIIGFNVRATKQAKDAANSQNITLNYYNIIYDLVDDIKSIMSGLLTPERRETFLGNAEVLEIFNITKVGKIAGCRITEGKIERGAGVRLIRDNVVIHEGKLKVLKRFKNEVSEAFSGQECGMAFENYEDMHVGDIIEAFRVEHFSRSL
ncbi:translation initiation factor IF-2 [Bartonella sp. DGB1]|uniref:translation initiation factor IF-2 n=1 Tax=Bartonella sp. DGB1 TaxID=3239807 RepID=UPI0035250263